MTLVTGDFLHGLLELKGGERIDGRNEVSRASKILWLWRLRHGVGSEPFPEFYCRRKMHRCSGSIGFPVS